MHDLNLSKQFLMDLKSRKTTHTIFAFLLILFFTRSFGMIVKKCPITETAWETRSQNVTCKSPLVYHCIQDEDRKLMETCMVAYKVKPFEEGGCPWAYHSTERGSILGIVFHSCEGIGCPHQNDSDYWTNQLYKYPVCLHHYDETTTISPPGATEVTSVSSIVSVGAIIAIVTTVVFIAVLVWICRRRLNSSKPLDVDSCDIDKTSTNPLIHTEKSTEVIVKFQESGIRDQEKTKQSIQSEVDIKDILKSIGKKDSGEITNIRELEDMYKERRHHWELPEHDKGFSKEISNLKIVQTGGRSAMHTACLEGDTNTVKSLIDNSETLKEKDKNGCTPLHLAAHSGSVNLVRYLVDKQGCNVYSKDDIGRTIVHIACETGHIELVEYLMDEIDKDILRIKDNDGRMPFQCYDKYGRTILYKACYEGNVRLVKLLIELDKNILNGRDEFGMSPFHMAGYSGSVKVAQYLLDNGCDVHNKDNYGQTIVHIACVRGHMNLVKYLISKNSGILNIKENIGLTPFHYVGFSGSVELVEYLIGQGCDICSKDNDGQTIVHVACIMGHVGLVKYFIEKDRYVMNLEDLSGRTPINCAELSRSSELLQYLSDIGVE